MNWLMSYDGGSARPVDNDKRLDNSIGGICWMRDFRGIVC